MQADDPRDPWAFLDSDPSVWLEPTTYGVVSYAGASDDPSKTRRRQRRFSDALYLVENAAMVAGHRRLPAGSHEIDGPFPSNDEATYWLVAAVEMAAKFEDGMGLGAVHRFVLIDYDDHIGIRAVVDGKLFAQHVVSSVAEIQHTFQAFLESLAGRLSYPSGSGDRGSSSA